MARYNSDTAHRLYQIGGADLALNYVDQTHHAADSYADSARINVLELWFYAAGPHDTPTPQRQLDRRFARQRTEYIWFYLKVQNPWKYHSVNARLHACYLDPNNEVLGQLEDEIRFSAGYASYVYQSGLGWAQPGNWPEGSYRLNLTVDGEPLESRSFSVYDNSPDNAFAPYVFSKQP